MAENKWVIGVKCHPYKWSYGPLLMTGDGAHLVYSFPNFPTSTFPSFQPRRRTGRARPLTATSFLAFCAGCHWVFLSWQLPWKIQQFVSYLGSTPNQKQWQTKVYRDSLLTMYIIILVVTATGWRVDPNYIHISEAGFVDRDPGFKAKWEPSCRLIKTIN